MHICVSATTEYLLTSELLSLGAEGDEADAVEAGSVIHQL
jgi:hypothetical protein